jgi:peptidoglycan-associated lipoprotein
MNKFILKISITFIFLNILFIGCSINKVNPDVYFSQKKYNLALLSYQKMFASTKEESAKAKAAFRIGQCYKFQAEYKKSLDWFKVAYDQGYGLKSLEEMAFGLKRQEEYTEAIQAFQKLINEVQDKSIFRKEVSMCKMAQSWKKSNSKLKISVFPKSDINTEFSDFSACYDRSGNILFSSDRIGSTGSDIYNWTGRLYTDIFKWDALDKSITDIKTINSKHHEATPSIANLKKKIYFTHCSKDASIHSYCQIFVSELENDEYSNPEQLDLYDSESNSIQPAIHKSDSILIFSSDRNKDRKFDLYISFKVNDLWSEPEALPNTINSEGNESFPSWYNDTLFFSSDFLPGMGGLDIFKTYRMSNGKWAMPQNQKFPINSGADDFGLCVDPNFSYNDGEILRGIFSSNRIENKRDDIYEFFIESINDTAAIVEKKYEFEVSIKFNFKEKPAINSEISAAKYIDSVELNSTVLPVKLNTFDKTSISIILTPDQRSRINFTRRGYLNSSFDIDIESPEFLTKDSIVKIVQEIELIPIKIRTEFLIENVYYDYDKYELKETSFESLDKLVDMLELNPNMKLEIRSHTDCRGEEDYNLELSKKRAESVVNYLVGKGILNSRLTYKGLGESELFDHCNCEDCSEESHQKNRRTSFQLID